MTDMCWCLSRIKALEYQVRQGMLKSDYCKIEAEVGGRMVLTHEWTVKAAGTELYCWKA